MEGLDIETNEIVTFPSRDVPLDVEKLR